MICNELRTQYTALLTAELMPALGCTEPTAIAYAAAIARDTLGAMPEQLLVQCSGNVIKNVKGVIIPGTKDLRGIAAAALLGALGGDAALKLETLTGITQAQIEQTRILLDSGICKVELLPGVPGLDIRIYAKAGRHDADVQIAGSHTNIVGVRRDGQSLWVVPSRAAVGSPNERIPALALESILAFAENVPEIVRSILLRQAQTNFAIAEEGVRHAYGANVGRSLLRMGARGTATRAAAYAAAGSDARMNGCQMPVVINSGSGNQGITVSVPVVVYARALHAAEDELVRALAISNLVSIRIKSGIGALSAFCGAVSAAAGCGAAIAALHHASPTVIAGTITNTLGSVSGIICDGAKSSCAAKIAAAVNAAILGWHMAEEGHTFQPGEGLVMGALEETIDAVCRVGREGMRETDLTILRLMTE